MFVPNPWQAVRDFKVSTLSSYDLVFSSPDLLSKLLTYTSHALLVLHTWLSHKYLRLSISKAWPVLSSFLIQNPGTVHIAICLWYKYQTNEGLLFLFCTSSLDLSKCSYPMVPTRTQTPMFWQETHSTLAKQRFPFSHGLRSSEKYSQPMKASEAEATFILLVSYPYPVSFIFRGLAPLSHPCFGQGEQEGKIATILASSVGLSFMNYSGSFTQQLPFPPHCLEPCHLAFSSYKECWKTWFFSWACCCSEQIRVVRTKRRI